jgi:hypothetical protein
VLRYHSLRHSAAPPEAAGNAKCSLSARAVSLYVITLSVLGWTAILLPLWAITHSS